MNTKELDRIFSFMTEAVKVKKVNRTGWVRFGMKNPEHVGDHMFSAAVLSYLLARRLSLDADKCLKMALTHDIHEAITGDIAARRGRETERKRMLERKDNMAIMSYLGGRSEFLSLVKEFMAEKTKESRFVHEVDKLDYVVQLAHYSKYLSAEAVLEFLSSADKKIYTPEVRYIYEKVRSQIYRERHWKDDTMANQGAGGGCECGGGCRCGCTNGCRCKENCDCGCTCGERRKERHGDLAY